MREDPPHARGCNACHRTLTPKELAVYDTHWLHSGDLYCADCRDCPDDCRRTPCLLDVGQEHSLLDLVGYLYEGAAYHCACFPYEDVDVDDDEVEAVCESDEDAGDLLCECCLYPLVDCDAERRAHA